MKQTSFFFLLDGAASEKPTVEAQAPYEVQGYFLRSGLYRVICPTGYTVFLGMNIDKIHHLTAELDRLEAQPWCIPPMLEELRGILLNHLDERARRAYTLAKTDYRHRIWRTKERIR